MILTSDFWPLNSDSLILDQKIEELPGGSGEDLAFAMNYPYGAEEILGEIDCAKRPGPQLVLDSRPRDYRNTEIGFDRTLDRLYVVKLHNGLDRDSPLAKYLIDGLASRYVALEGYKPLPVKALNIYLFSLRERVVGAANEHEPVASERDYIDLRAGRRIGDYAKIDRAVYHIIIDLVRAAVLYVNIDLRIGFYELLDDRRQLVEPDRIYGGDPDLPANDIAQPFYLLGERGVAFEYLSTSLIEDPPCGGRDKPATAALDKLAVETVFECADLLAHRRL